MNRDIIKKLKPDAASKLLFMRSLNEVAAASSKYMLRGSLIATGVGLVFANPAFIAFNGLAATGNFYINRFNKRHAAYWGSLPETHILPSGTCKRLTGWTAARALAPIALTLSCYFTGMATLPVADAAPQQTALRSAQP